MLTFRAKSIDLTVLLRTPATSPLEMASFFVIALAERDSRELKASLRLTAQRRFSDARFALQLKSRNVRRFIHDSVARTSMNSTRRKARLAAVSNTKLDSAILSCQQLRQSRRKC